MHPAASVTLMLTLLVGPAALSGCLETASRAPLAALPPEGVPFLGLVEIGSKGNTAHLVTVYPDGRYYALRFEHDGAHNLSAAPETLSITTEEAHAQVAVLSRTTSRDATNFTAPSSGNFTFAKAGVLPAKAMEELRRKVAAADTPPYDPPSPRHFSHYPQVTLSIWNGSGYTLAEDFMGAPRSTREVWFSLMALAGVQYSHIG